MYNIYIHIIYIWFICIYILPQKKAWEILASKSTGNLSLKPATIKDIPGPPHFSSISLGDPKRQKNLRVWMGTSGFVWKLCTPTPNG
jgi:hypothetical protein